jgi:uncharacterized membrane protein YhaH (DUF805 family)
MTGEAGEQGAVPPLGEPAKVGPVAAVARAFRGSFLTHGRASRPEYWWYALVVGLVVTAVVLAEIALQGSGIVTLLVVLVQLPATVSVTVRRLHDGGYSGAWWFVQFLPFIGAFWLLILLVQPSQRLRNPWGPGPDSHLVER